MTDPLETIISQIERQIYTEQCKISYCNFQRLFDILIIVNVTLKLKFYSMIYQNICCKPNQKNSLLFDDVHSKSMKIRCFLIL